MARIVKKAEERRKEILEKAEKLFYKFGYTNTSVNMVIKALNISKGAFYHHFKSKEELLDCLVKDFTNNLVERIEGIITIPHLNAPDKLNKLYLESSSYKAENIDTIITITEAIYNNNNILFRHKFHAKSVEKMLPIMTAIFQQGKDEGYFQISDPEATARLVLLFGISVAEYSAKLLLQLQDNPQKIDELYEHFMLYQNSIERILGAAQGSIQVFDKKFFDVFKTLYNSSSSNIGI